MRAPLAGHHGFTQGQDLSCTQARGYARQGTGASRGFTPHASAGEGGFLTLAANGLPPSSVKTTDWSLLPGIKYPDGNNFLLRVPGDANGLYRAVEEVLDTAGVPG